MPNFVLVENSFEEVRNPDFFDKVALVAHNCYQVAEKDHEANKAFISRLVNSGHLAMIEHYRFLFSVSESLYTRLLSLQNPYILLRETEIQGKKTYLVSLSLRPLLEDEKDNRLFDPIRLALPSEVRAILPPVEETEEKASLVQPNQIKDFVSSHRYEELEFVTYHLVTDRGVTHELVRHRACSFAQESTRYCNYTKDKFNHCLAFMKPLRYEEFKDTYDRFYSDCVDAYFALIGKGATPDEARSVLPNSLKASIMVTCSLQEWRHIFELRCDPHAHADIRRLMLLVQEDMQKKGYLQ